MPWIDVTLADKIALLQKLKINLLTPVIAN
jgi:hypothetical protein